VVITLDENLETSSDRMSAELETMTMTAKHIIDDLASLQYDQHPLVGAGIRMAITHVRSMYEISEED